MLVPEEAARPLTDDYFVWAFVGASASLTRRGLQVVLTTGDVPGELWPSFITGGHADGVIVASHHGHDLGRAMLAQPRPAVFVGVRR